MMSYSYLNTTSPNISSLEGSNLTNSLITTTSTIATKDQQHNILNPHFVILVEVACILIFLLGIFGNTLVLFVFGSRWSKLKTCEVFMINLAVSDLIGTIVVPVNMFLELLNFNYHSIGDTGCKIISFLSMVTITVSSLSLLIISIDRFIIVKWPLRKDPETWQIGFTIFVTWFIAMSISLVYLVGGKIRLHDDPTDNLGEIHVCRSFMTRQEEVLHKLVVFFVQIVAPLTTMTILYYLIVRELRQLATSHLFQQNERDIRLRLKRNRKATYLFVTIVTVFYILVLPSNIFFLIYILVGINRPLKELFLIFTLLQMILMLNSCVNPLIYSNLHTSFRRSTLKLLCSCLFKRFKSYQWGDSIRTAIRNSSRSVRESLTLHSFRARLSSDAFFNSPRTGLIRDRLSPNNAHFSPTQRSTVTTFEDVDLDTHRDSVDSPMLGKLRSSSRTYIETIDDVFNESRLTDHTKLTDENFNSEEINKADLPAKQETNKQKQFKHQFTEEEIL